MSHEKLIESLEKQLQAEETKVNALYQAGKIPAPGDYAEIDRIKRELKTARRVRAMDAKRVDPKLSRKVSILLSEFEYVELMKKAEVKGVDLSKYIRALLKLAP